MEQKIKDLINHHKENCQELEFLLNELYDLKNKVEDSDGLIEKYSNELAWRKVFVGQLEDIL